jgi:hypothetical protein
MRACSVRPLPALGPGALGKAAHRHFPQPFYFVKILFERIIFVTSGHYPTCSNIETSNRGYTLGEEEARGILNTMSLQFLVLTLVLMVVAPVKTQVPWCGATIGSITC